MNTPFQGVLDFLNQAYGPLTQRAIASRLGLSQPQVSQFLTRSPIIRSRWRSISSNLFRLGYTAGRSDTTRGWFQVFLEAYANMQQSRIARSLHLTQPTISNWKTGKASPSKAQIRQLLNLFALGLVDPVMEFKPIEPVSSGRAWRLSQVRHENVLLKQALSGKVGIYVFYDSAGNVTYLGKTARDLYAEAKQRLAAKVNRPFYSPERRKKGVCQGQIARYLSAYRVNTSAAIHNLEVLMLRSIPNDLANTNIGRFKSHL